MLKSTHQIARPAAALPPLPPGWTEHKAPTGHTYYYNPSTGQSTYNRPSGPPVLSPAQVGPFILGGPGQFQPFDSGLFPNSLHGPQGRQSQHSSIRGARGGRGDANGRPSFNDRRRKLEQDDRPKSKHQLKGQAPWLIVRTKYGRRFVHNPEENQSLWRIPDHLREAVSLFDAQEKERETRRARGEDSEAAEVDEGEKLAPGASERPGAQRHEPLSQVHNDDSSEYEEVEVTDDEADGNSPKRQRVEDQAIQPQEFNEDDIAFQLAAMGQDYGLDPGEYGEGNEEGEEVWEEGAEGMALTNEDSSLLFKDLLEDYHISPYSTWEKILEEGKIIEDERYLVLSNMKSRREVWDEWSREQILKLKEERKKMEKKDPRIPYLKFLQQHATPKLYWPEFKRKFKKEPEMRDMKLSDKDREKLYRDHIARLKLPLATLKSDLSALLKSQPLASLNRSTETSHLPPSLLTDIRYISLPADQRDALVEVYIQSLPDAPSGSFAQEEEDEDGERRRKDRQRRERALAERELQVAAQKRRQQQELGYGQGRLREEEAQIERAMQVGKAGLKAQLSTSMAKADPLLLEKSDPQKS